MKHMVKRGSHNLEFLNHFTINAFFYNNEAEMIEILLSNK
jgi:hypothetical protein